MKLMILDGNSIINRTFYGIRMLNAPDGRPVNAVYGFLTVLHKLLEDERPDALCVAFDLKGPTFRHEQFEAYKAQRKPMPEELAVQLHKKEGEPFWILLAHRNDRFASQYSYLHADLTVSGHGHGGMIRLPGTDGLIGTQRNWFPSYTAGFYTANGSRLFVSRGLGNSGPSFRLFNRPEIAVLTLENH